MAIGADTPLQSIQLPSLTSLPLVQSPAQATPTRASNRQSLSQESELLHEKFKKSHSSKKRNRLSNQMYLAFSKDILDVDLQPGYSTPRQPCSFLDFSEWNQLESSGLPESIQDLLMQNESCSIQNGSMNMNKWDRLLKSQLKRNQFGVDEMKQCESTLIDSLKNYLQNQKSSRIEFYSQDALMRLLLHTCARYYGIESFSNF